MDDWRETILKEFFPNVSKLTLAADPDCLLTEEQLYSKLRQRGFDLIEFDDSIAFRYEYESKYRAVWDRGEHTDLVVILRLQDSELSSLPYDLLQAGRKLYFNLGDIFPNLSYPVIEQLDRSMLDDLFKAQQNTQPDRLGDNATKDYILHHVYGISLDMISDEIRLLRTLLRLHYSKTKMPVIFSQRFVWLLRENTNFQSWDLEKIVPDEKAFFAFLQERWPVFIDHFAQKDQIKEKSFDYGFKYQGPNLLPFNHQDIRIYIDNLFLEGRLSSIIRSETDIDTNSWIKIGIKKENNDSSSRISGLFKLLNENFPTIKSSYSDWINFALKWAELSALIHCTNNESNYLQFQKMGQELNKIFAIWLTGNYSALINLPPTNPAMLHHISRHIARDMEKSKNHLAALIVMDGLALDQWVTMRQILQENDSRLIMSESAVFAWIPTLTSVSRQSIFAGRPPNYFPSSIKTTNNEEKLWKQFWENNKLKRCDIAYARGLSDGDVENIMDSVINPGKTKAVGLVVDKIDKIMHGIQLGAPGMHNQIKQWCKKGFLLSLINYLLDNNYEIWMTSDHGNIECKGKGRPSEGVIAETKGERVRIYPAKELRSQIAADFPFAHEWHPIGLPPDCFPLVASDNHAFVKHGETIVGHGGISIEEVIVPFVNFKRNTR
ncbi:Alkaline phosphatase domain-containing protein [Desulfonema limicola]|uniref:Alkaline phosphatase domain-containing protein n=1 Tax=Desulfonema limicola TaxID=45656 RepID=A0A975B5Q0_9BACT|nr:BREX-3 system phosphatase PglZ [Desulfonema limicola]QTA79276.1 Alkaline phosphatase domain-containing protein [Desulfonema limicola]